MMRLLEGNPEIHHPKTNKLVVYGIRLPGMHGFFEPLRRNQWEI